MKSCIQCGVEVDFYVATITPEGSLCPECAEKKKGSTPGRPGKVDAPKTDDPVDHPAHYTQGPIEVIDALESFFPGVDFHKASAMKYIARAGHKGDEVEDLRKAAWFLARAISRLEG